jgi:hypothetical protein
MLDPNILALLWNIIYIFITIIHVNEILNNIDEIKCAFSIFVFSMQTFIFTAVKHIFHFFSGVLPVQFQIQPIYKMCPSSLKEMYKINEISSFLLSMQNLSFKCGMKIVIFNLLVSPLIKLFIFIPLDVFIPLDENKFCIYKKTLNILYLCKTEL